MELFDFEFNINFYFERYATIFTYKNKNPNSTFEIKI